MSGTSLPSGTADTRRSEEFSQEEVEHFGKKIEDKIFIGLFLSVLGAVGASTITGSVMVVDKVLSGLAGGTREVKEIRIPATLTGVVIAAVKVLGGLVAGTEEVVKEIRKSAITGAVVLPPLIGAAITMECALKKTMDVGAKVGAKTAEALGLGAYRNVGENVGVLLGGCTVAAASIAGIVATALSVVKPGGWMNNSLVNYFLES